MIRKFNYTERKRILRNDVSITLIDDAGEKPRGFDASLHFEDMNLPEHARIYVEAYRASAYKRFNFGTVANPIPPTDRSVEDLESTLDLRFRVKVVDESHRAGLLLAVAENLTPNVLGDHAKKRDPLVPLNVVDLGERVWRLNFEAFPDGPVMLEVNSRIENIEFIVKQDKGFRAVVFPAILEQVLTFVLRQEEFDPDDDNPDDEVRKWLQFVGGFFSDPVPEESQREEWISDAVSAFCTRSQLREQFEQSRNSG
jgi:hypothetical protein